MLIRISLIVAVVAGLAVGVINFVQVKTVITTTRQERDDFHTRLDTETTEHGKTKRELSSTKDELASTRETLKSTEDARDRALADAESNRKRATDLADKLNKTTRERDDAQADLAAWAALGIPVEQVKTLIADLKAAQQAIEVAKEENKILTGKVRKLENELARYRDPEYRVALPQGLKAKVLVSDPKWDFVVLDAGENQGVLEFGELLVNRNGKLVAKVRILRVDKDRCIGNVVPGWKLGDVVEGDSAIPAF
jgi:cell shape-determining protein MreC